MKQKKGPREWILLGRPWGEWIFLTMMALLGLNAIRNGLTEEFSGSRQWSVQAGNIIYGIAALGVVLATVTGRAIGISLLWLFALTVCVTGPMAAWSYGDATISGALLALLGTFLVSMGVIWYGTRRLHASITLKRWPAVMAEHAAASDEFVAAISGMSLEEWTSRPSPEAWSPAEITDHLARTYSQFAGEARGKNSLRIRLGPVPRTLARIFVKPFLLAGKPFPKARSPRELRPSSGPATPADGIALFRATGDACLRDLKVLHLRRPYRRMVHPYLGALPLYELVQFAAQHVRHHRRQLPS
ncbi:MAG: DinB family protein [Gemmatimonadota bacterium]